MKKKAYSKSSTGTAKVVFAEDTARESRDYRGIRYSTLFQREKVRLRYSCGNDKALLPLSERKRRFSEAAETLVSEILLGRVELYDGDIQLIVDNGGAIHINERVSSHTEFQKMIAATSCVSMLKTLAEMALWGCTHK